MEEPIHVLRSQWPMEEPGDMEERIELALRLDDKVEFVKLINQPEFEEVRDVIGPDIVFQFDAVNCAAAVLNGETEGVLDLRDVMVVAGSTPLHCAASYHACEITKFLLQRGDQVDVKCEFLKQATPLDIVIENLGYNGKWHDWTPQKSIFELLILLCGTMLRSDLETVRLLVQHTQNKEQVARAFLNYAAQGKLLQTGALLVAAPELFFQPCSSVEGGLSCLDILLASLKVRDTLTEMEEGLLLLLDLFATIGDKLIAYTRLETDIKNVRSAGEVAHLLRDAFGDKQGGLIPDDYFLRFFKPVKSEAGQGACQNQNMPSGEYVYELDGCKGCGETMLLRFDLKRRNIQLDYIDSVLPDLKREDADRLHEAIEKKLSSWPPLRRHPETRFGNPRSDVKEKQLAPACPIPPRISQPAMRMLHTWSFCPKPPSDFKFAVQTDWRIKTNGAALLKQSKLRSFPSAMMAANLTSIAKRLIK